MTRRPAQGAMTPAQRAVSPAEEAAFASIEVEMGGRARLVSVLASAQLPKAIEQVLGMIADPLHDHESLARICALGNVSLPKLMKVFQEAISARGKLLAQTRIAEKMPDVAAAVMESAVPGWRDCRECMATGTVEVEEPARDEDGKVIKPLVLETRTKTCPACKGRCVVWVEPNHEVQKTALKMSRLLDSDRASGGVNILNANLQGQPGDTGNFDKMMEALDGVLYGTGRDRLRKSRATAADDESIDGEVVDDQE